MTPISHNLKMKPQLSAWRDSTRDKWQHVFLNLVSQLFKNQYNASKASNMCSICNLFQPFFLTGKIKVEVGNFLYFLNCKTSNMFVSQVFSAPPLSSTFNGSNSKWTFFKLSHKCTVPFFKKRALVIFYNWAVLFLVNVFLKKSNLHFSETISSWVWWISKYLQQQDSEMWDGLISYRPQSQCWS